MYLGLAASLRRPRLYSCRRASRASQKRVLSSRASRNRLLRRGCLRIVYVFAGSSETSMALRVSLKSLIFAHSSLIGLQVSQIRAQRVELYPCVKREDCLFSSSTRSRISREFN